MAKIKLGRRYQDIILGIEGMAFTLTKHLTGCDRVGIKTINAKGEPKVYEWDDTRVKLVRGEAEQEHTPVKSKIKLGEIYQDRSTKIIGTAMAMTEHVGVNHMIIGLETMGIDGEPVHSNSQEPLLDKVSEKPNAAAKQVEEAGKAPRKNGAGAFSGLGMGMG
jgi:hypothetical protein